MNDNDWVVQAHLAGLGWRNVNAAEHRTEAEGLAQELRGNDSAWTEGEKRRVRIVPREQAKV